MTPQKSPSSIITQPREWAQYFRDKVTIPSEDWRELNEREHRWAFTIAKVTQAQLLESTLKDLEAQMRDPEGSSYQEFVNNFEVRAQEMGWAAASPGGTNWRGRLIFHQNTANAYADGRWGQMTSPDLLSLTAAWRWVHRTPWNPRARHIALDGRLFPPGEQSFEGLGFPPGGHFFCRCLVQSIPKGMIPTDQELAPLGDIPRYRPGFSPDERDEIIIGMFLRLTRDFRVVFDDRWFDRLEHGELDLPPRSGRKTPRLRDPRDELKNLGELMEQGRSEMRAITEVTKGNNPFEKIKSIQDKLTELKEELHQVSTRRPRIGMEMFNLQDLQEELEARGEKLTKEQEKQLRWLVRERDRLMGRMNKLRASVERTERRLDSKTLESNLRRTYNYLLDSSPMSHEDALRVARGLLAGFDPIEMPFSNETLLPLPDLGKSRFEDHIARALQISSGGPGNDLHIGYVVNNSRAYASKYYRVLNIGRASDGETDWTRTPGRNRSVVMFHELGHFIEFNNNDIRDIVHQWIQDRATGPLEKLSVLTNNPGFDDTEWAHPGPWFSPYVGKSYPDSTEVISMGFENFANTERLKFLARHDPEHLQAMLGVLRVLRHRYPQGTP